MRTERKKDDHQTSVIIMHDGSYCIGGDECTNIPRVRDVLDQYGNALDRWRYVCLFSIPTWNWTCLWGKNITNNHVTSNVWVRVNVWVNLLWQQVHLDGALGQIFQCCSWLADRWCSRQLCSLYSRVSRCNFKSRLTKFRSAVAIPDEAERRQARNSLIRNFRPLFTAVKLLLAHPLLFYLSARRLNWRLARGTFNRRNVL